MPDKTAASTLTLEIERKDNEAVVTCHGKLVAYGCGTLYSTVYPLIGEYKRIVLDLTDLAYMDSMGIGTLVRLYVSAKSRGCELPLINLGKRVRELLGLTHLLTVFTVIGEHGNMMKF
jgi:anti-sigma B factor antagonist